MRHKLLNSGRLRIAIKRGAEKEEDLKVKTLKWRHLKVA